MIFQSGMTRVEVARRVMMEAINDFYARLLEVGFIVLRQAIDAKDWEWVEAERRHLHNVPSLLNETNLERHRYFWFQEREQYLEWVGTAGPEQKSRMLTYYSPIWQEMEPAMKEFLSSPVFH